MDALVEFLSQLAHLALGNIVHAKRVDQIVNRVSGNALDVGLLDYRRQRPLGHPTWF